MSGLDAHLKPPEDLRYAFKALRAKDDTSLKSYSDVFDAAIGSYAGFTESTAAKEELCMPPDLKEVLKRFFSRNEIDDMHASVATCFEHSDLPGLYVFPSLVPHDVQISLLDRMFHRDASNQEHRTNLHLHYDVAYPPDSSLSYFDAASSDLLLMPKDPHIHNSLNIKSMLNKKLRWITLGGQYDWTAKEYPSTPPPPFPEDIAALIDGIFPAMKAEAAILNLYSPGDTLSLHRDVSEFCDRPLASLSLGCDGIFMVGLESELGGKSKYAALRLRSGDVVVMSGAARFAWHGVPKVLAGTCPRWMQDWPSLGEEGQRRFAAWKGWMAGKRINLNVRQMHEK